LSFVASAFGHILVVTVMSILVALFAAIYARDRSRMARLWLFGWLCIELHFAVPVLQGFHLIAETLGDWLAYTTLVVTAGCFFLSVAPACPTTRLRTGFWTLVAAPAVLYWTLLVAAAPHVWIYRLTLGVLVAGGCAVTHWSERKRVPGRSRRASVRFYSGVALAALPGVVFLVWMPSPVAGMSLILASAYYGCALAYWFHYRRVSPGVLFTCFSLFAWGCVWPGATLVQSFGLQVPEGSVLWDLPKYFVAFGMIVTLFEDRTAALTNEIAEREQVETALRETDRWLRVSQEVSHIGSLTYDFATRAWTSSEALDQILGIPPNYLKTLGALVSLVEPEERVALESYVLEQVLAAGHDFDREFPVLRSSDGQMRWVHGRGALLRDAAGNPLRIAGTIQDITERKSVEEELRQAHKIESLGRLAGGVAHDFNNLLTVINGYSDLLMTTTPPDNPDRSYLAEIRSAGERAAELTNQLLAFSRRQLLQPRLLDLSTIVHSTERMLRRLIGEHIQLEMRLAPDLGLVRADPGQINQVLVNLAANARDAMPQGGRFVVTTENVDLRGSDAERPEHRTPGRYVRLTLTDTGCGMDEEIAGHLFEPFFTTKLVGKGTGLGLPTVHGIIHQSGGWIDVRSQPNIGTSFRIYLPCVDKEGGRPAEEPAEEAAVPRADGGGETVLLVEDQDNVRELTAKVLRGLGYRVLEASGGEQALALSAAFQGVVHLVLTDVVMPRMSGSAVAESLKLQRPDVRVLYMSGYTDDMIVRHGIREREVEFLSKPFTPEQLARKVRQVLEASA
jgi:PAS domain S-box-containing protein